MGLLRPVIEWLEGRKYPKRVIIILEEKNERNSNIN